MCIHGPGSIIPPLVGASFIVQTMVITDPLQSDCKSVSSLCTNPHSYSFFRYCVSMPTLLTSLSRFKAQSGQCSCHFDFTAVTASGAPPLLSGRIILEKPHARGPHL